MKNIDIAKAYIKDSAIILQESEHSFKQGHYHRTVRKCQESVELALKGLLRLKGIEYPKSHKIGKVLIDTFRTEVEMDFLQKAAELSDRLAVLREPSFYGSEDVPAKELFKDEEVEEILESSKYVINFIIENYLGSEKGC